MRLWSIHPRYLDSKGLVALWREALLAQSVLLKGEYSNCPDCEGINIRLNCKKCLGSTKIKTPYYNHPQLIRFKKQKAISLIQAYLIGVYNEGKRRGYNFDKNKIIPDHSSLVHLTVTREQLKYEFGHLMNKLLKRNPEWAYKISIPYGCKMEAHPLFRIVEGEIESWEKRNTING